MFNSIGWPEIAVLVVIALFVFGPDRLPKVAAEAGRMLRGLRRLADDARDDLRAELGPELGDLDLTALNPKAFVRKHLLDDLDMGDLRLDDGEKPVRRKAQTRLGAGEPAPYDADAT